jgi:hypothetical protein
MTLEQLFVRVADEPSIIMMYFGFIPIIAFVANIMGKGEGNLAPWKELYAALIFLVAIPGIFAFTLNVYLFLFEKRSIFQTEIYTQILPIASMILTLLIIRQNADFSHIPGFDKLSSLITMITCTLCLMWFVDRTHIVIFSYMPFQQVLLIFAVLLIVIRLGWSRIFSK